MPGWLSGSTSGADAFDRPDGGFFDRENLSSVVFRYTGLSKFILVAFRSTTCRYTKKPTKAIRMMIAATEPIINPVMVPESFASDWRTSSELDFDVSLTFTAIVVDVVVDVVEVFRNKRCAAR